jgi:hypothetical protein
MGEQSVLSTDRYRVGDAVDELRQLGTESAAVVVLDDAWARPGRDGAFGVEYPTHSLEVSCEIVDASWDVLKSGGWLICDADDWLAPRLESHIREEYGDVTAYGDYQGGGYRRRGGVTYVDASGEPDQSTPGQYLSNGGYPVVFAHKGSTDRRSTASARQLARHPRRVEDAYPYGRGSVKPVKPYRRWIEGLTEPDETVVEPCAGTGPASIAAASLGRKSIAIDIEEEARDAHRRRKSAYLQSEQTTLVTDGGGWNDRPLRTDTDGGQVDG